MRRVGFVILLVALASAMAPSSASAGGFDYAAPGTRALGRGGAFYARADDPMALLYNPANLGSLSGNQLMLNVHLGWFDACFDPAGQYEPNSFYPTIFDADPDDSATWGEWVRDYPEVCNGGPPGPSPDLAFTTRLTRDIGIGFGLVAPAAVGHNIYTDEVDPGTITQGGQLLPAPGRYLLLEEQLLIFYPTVGIGWRVAEWLQVGGAFQWGIGFFEFTNQTRALPGQNPDGDILSELTASDLFIPAGVLSVHAIPHDNLDIVLSARLHADIGASGDTRLTWGPYSPAATSVDGTPIRTVTEVPNTELRAQQPFTFALGIRYADRFAPRPRDTSAVERLSGRVEDSMSNERWDVELDVVYERNKRVRNFLIDLPDDAELVLQNTPAGSATTVLPLPDEIRIPHRWRDQLSIRLGGDWNVIPGMAALRLGASFETDGSSPSYTGIDFIPGQRFGIHGGLTVRLGRLDISLAYAHIFQADITIEECPPAAMGETEPQRTARCEANDQAAYRQISAEMPEAADIVNAGVYTANYDIVSLGVTWHIP